MRFRMFRLGKTHLRPNISEWQAGYDLSSQSVGRWTRASVHRPAMSKWSYASRCVTGHRLSYHLSARETARSPHHGSRASLTNRRWSRSSRQRATGSGMALPLEVPRNRMCIYGCPY